jgi:cytochrome P450
MLVNDVRKFDKGVQFDKARAFLGDGLASSSEPLHLRQRRLIQPAFHHTRIAQYARDMHKIAEEGIGSWRPGQKLHLDQEFHVITITIVARVLFSADLDGAFAAEIIRCLPPFLVGYVKRMLYPLKIMEKLPTRANREFDAARVRLGTALSKIINEYWQETTDHGDLMSMLRDARDDETGEQMSQQQIFDEAITMLIAGTETTATVLSWACHLLSTHPDVQRRVVREVDEVLSGQPMTPEDVPRLEYTRRVLTEAMRLYPPGWLLTRRAIVDVELGGHHIPAGSSMTFSPYAMHRDPALYPDPDRFDPDRWTGDHKQRESRASYLPFAAGNRSCIGEGFAWTEMLIIMANLLSRWTLHPVPGHAIRPQAHGTLRPSPLTMRLEERNRP